LGAVSLTRIEISHRYASVRADGSRPITKLISKSVATDRGFLTEALWELERALLDEMRNWVQIDRRRLAAQPKCLEWD
jgi:hypothetical protein